MISASAVTKRHELIMSLVAPLKKGQTVGELSVKVKGQDLYYLDGATSIKLKAKTDKAVDKANIFVIAWRAIKGVFNR